MPLVEDPRRPSGRPGTRVPHIVLHRNGAAVSTHDLANRRYVLLAGRRGHQWIQAANALAAAGVGLDIHRIGADGDLGDPGGSFENTMGIGDEGALLLRPDGVIAWRTGGAHRDARTRLEEVMRGLRSLG